MVGRDKRANHDAKTMMLEVDHELCQRCFENGATKKWLGDGGVLALVHGGGKDWCERCVVEEQTVHARERAVELAALEEKLIELGGPSSFVRCNMIYPRKVTEREIGEWEGCWLNKGHEGKHGGIPIGVVGLEE